MNRIGRIVQPAAALLLLSAASACADDGEAILEGKRVPVFEEQAVGLEGLLASLGFDEGPQSLPESAGPAPWTQQGGAASHAPGRLSLRPLESLEPAWRVSVGRFGGEPIPAPVVANGRVFAFDGGGEVMAFSAEGGERLWSRRLDPGTEEAAYAFGGGIALEGERLFVVGGFGLVHALSTEDGSVLWRARVGEPMRAPPAVGGGRVFVVTLSNRTVALSAEDGSVLWTHSGSPQRVFVAYSAGAALQGSDLIVPHSNGEFLALVAETGREIWAENAGSGGGEGVALRSPALPVLDAGEAFLLGPGGFTALTLSSGEVLWETEFPGGASPWVAGSHLFMTDGSSLLALARATGAVRWVVPLSPEEEESRRRRRDDAVWHAPRLVEEGVLVLSSSGEAAVFDPESGAASARRSLRGDAASAPVVGEGLLVYATEGGALVAFR